MGNLLIGPKGRPGEAVRVVGQLLSPRYDAKQPVSDGKPQALEPLESVRIARRNHSIDTAGVHMVFVLAGAEPPG